MEINEFIKTNYEVIYGDVNQADEFLLIDSPESLGHREINSLFINSYATANDIVLVQSIPSMKEIKATEAPQSLWLKTTAKIVGWDKGTVAEIQKLPVCIQNEKSEIKVNVILKQLHEAEGDTAELNKKLKEAIRGSFGLIGELFQHEKEIAENEAKALPDCMESMKNSLIEAKKQAKRSFLIAKSLYLIPEEENLKLAENQLEFIQQRSVVILLPKKIKVDELNKKYKNFCRSLFQETPPGA